MKWLLVAILIFLVVARTRRPGSLGELADTVKALPKRFRDGKARAADPASAAKPVERAPSDEGP
jgi:hypothetical protein